MYVYAQLGFPGGDSSEEPTCQFRRHRRMQVLSLAQEDPLEDEMVNNSSISARKIPLKRNLAGYSPWGFKQLDMTEDT